MRTKKGLQLFNTRPSQAEMKTVLPAEASAKMDFRLVPDQRPRDVFDKLRAHLDDQGFADVEIV